MFSMQHGQAERAGAKGHPNVSSPSRGPTGRLNPRWLRLATRVQPKLTVNQPGDQYEQEADRAADQVMRMTDPVSTCSAAAARVQRMCPACEEEELQRQPVEEEEEELQRQPIEEEEEELQAKSENPAGGAVTRADSGAIRSALASAQPLPARVRSFFEPRFGTDFSGVRIATSHQAAEAARSVRARAFTLGQSIAFNTGEYRPDTPDGRRLLAHELAHTIQQSGTSERVQRYVACEAGEDCPSRVSGETGRARRNPMQVAQVSNGVSGVLVANFAVGSGDVKTDLASNPDWTSFLSQVEGNPGIRWEVLGLTDCQGSESLNTTLRVQRAAAIFSILPPRVIVQMNGFFPLPLTDCISDNATEEGRTWNRSVFFRQVSTEYDFPGETVTANPFVACYDGTTVYANKGGRSYSCSAVTGSIGAPTPNGTYCIRQQGDAQRTTWYRDRSDWYLLEPQFSTTRSRMHLHPGSVSAGCITVTDEDCFANLAAVLNRPGTVSGAGYDGYPPGNSEGVTNPQRTVTCVGWLKVDRTSGGCSFMSGGSTSP